MRVLYINYDLWKTIATDNGLVVYERALDDTSAHIWAGSNEVVYRSNVVSSSFADYDSTFPTGSARLSVIDEDEAIARIVGLGVTLPNEVVAPTFENTDGLHPQWKGHLYNVTAGSINIFDELVTTEKQLRGGWYEIMSGSAELGDYIEEAVVDKDDALGLFSLYGLVTGSDVLELKKYVRTEYINPNSNNERQVFLANSTFLITAGLYTRTIYSSTGSLDLKIKITTMEYE